MCTLCITDARQLLPEDYGFYFAVAQKAESDDPGDIQPGDYMLGFINCPTWAFSVKPRVDDQSRGWFDDAQEFVGILQKTPARPLKYWRLVNACIEKGYSEKDGILGFWLFDHLGKFV